MSNNLQKWLNLESSRGLVGVQLLKENKHFTIQKNGMNQYTLLGDFDKATPFKKLPSIKGIIIDQIFQQNHNILMLSLENQALLKTFNNFALFLAEETIGLEGEELAKKTIKIIREWSDVFSKQRQGLEEHEIIGLICELHALKNHLFKIYDVNYSIRAWIGAEGSKQDFSCDKFVFDVKGHLVGRNDLIHISSIEQLDVEIGVPFFIFKVNILPGSTDKKPGDLSIRSLVNDIKDNLKNSPDSISLFEGKLNAIVDEATEENLDASYKLDQEVLYEVNNAFPFIKRKDLPEEVVNAKYDLNTALLEKYICKKSLSDILKDV